jgi:demethylmenaquinone methyltransferase/2-methoxy-6-polyprenyl-1,4-benzoquinol methylase
MFAAIAGSYDLNNRVHSLWQDQRWRRIAVKAADVRPGDAVLDVACGTGDLTQHFAKTEAARVVGADFTPAMLDVARQKLAKLDPRVATKISYEEGDAQSLRFADAGFDVVSIAFGIRNVEEPRRALGEFARVLRPGGRLDILEFEGRPPNAIMRWFNDLYCRRIMPRTATLISGDKSGAYKYLPASVGTFMTRGEMEEAMRSAGFADVSSRPLSLGICVCYRGVRRADK